MVSEAPPNLHRDQRKAAFWRGFRDGFTWGPIRRLFSRRAPVRAVVTITHWGQKTPTPHVTVGVASRCGSQSVYTHLADEQGNACATMYARSLAHILDLPLVDRREEKS